MDLWVHFTKGKQTLKLYFVNPYTTLFTGRRKYEPKRPGGSGQEAQGRDCLEGGGGQEQQRREGRIGARSRMEDVLGAGLA